MAAMQRILDAMSTLLMLIGGTAIVLMMLQIVVDAALRTLFGSSLPGTTEFVSFYYMVAVTFLPLAYIQRMRGHVIIELFTSRLDPRAIAAIDCAVFLLGSVAMAYFCYATFWKAMAMTAANEFVIGMILVTTWPSRWFVVLGTGLMSLYLVLHAVDKFLVAAGYREPRPADDTPHH